MRTVEDEEDVDQEEEEEEGSGGQWAGQLKWGQQEPLVASYEPSKLGESVRKMLIFPRTQCVRKLERNAA